MNEENFKKMYLIKVGYRYSIKEKPYKNDALLREVDRVELEGDKECCGFGGLFAVEMAAVSAAIMDEKLDRVQSSGADVLVGGDISCLIHIEGGLRRRGSQIQVKHIAELLAGEPE